MKSTYSICKVAVTNVVYDTESDGVVHDVNELKLPTEFNLELEGDNDIDTEIADVISDVTGWCVSSFNYEIV